MSRTANIGAACQWLGIPQRSFGADRGFPEEPVGGVITEQQSSVTLNVSAQFVDAAGGAEVVGRRNVVVQRHLSRLGSLASQSLRKVNNRPSSAASSASRPRKGPIGSAVGAEPTERIARVLRTSPAMLSRL